MEIKDVYVIKFRFDSTNYAYYIAVKLLLGFRTEIP
jgi:hypothetical protein